MRRTPLTIPPYPNGHETAGHLRAARYSGTMSTAHTKPLSELIDEQYQSYEKDAFDNPPEGPVGVHRGNRPMIVRVTPFIIVLVAAVAVGAFIRQQQAQGKRILPASGNILRAFTIPFDSVTFVSSGARDWALRPQRMATSGSGRPCASLRSFNARIAASVICSHPLFSWLLGRPPIDWSL